MVTARDLQSLGVETEEEQEEIQQVVESNDVPSTADQRRRFRQVTQSGSTAMGSPEDTTDESPYRTGGATKAAQSDEDFLSDTVAEVERTTGTDIPGEGSVVEGVQETVDKAKTDAGNIVDDIQKGIDESNMGLSDAERERIDRLTDEGGFLESTEGAGDAFNIDEAIESEIDRAGDATGVDTSGVEVDAPGDGAVLPSEQEVEDFTAEAMSRAEEAEAGAEQRTRDLIEQGENIATEAIETAGDATGQDTSAVEVDVPEPVVETVAGVEGGIARGLFSPAAGAGAAVTAAESGIEVFEGADDLETATLVSGAVGEAGESLADEAKKDPESLAGELLLGFVAGAGVSKAVRTGPNVARNINVRRKGGRVLDFEDVSDPPAQTMSDLPAFTEGAQQSGRAARQEFLEQARRTDLGGDEPVAFHGRTATDVREHGGFTGQFEAPEVPPRPKDPPGMAFSADLSPLRVSTGGATGVNYRIGLPTARLRGGRIAAERGVDVDVMEGQSIQAATEFMEGASREQSFVRSRGIMSPEQEVFAPVGARFVPTGEVFGVRAGGVPIPFTTKKLGGTITTGRVFRRGDVDMADGIRAADEAVDPDEILATYTRAIDPDTTDVFPTTAPTGPSAGPSSPTATSSPGSTSPDLGLPDIGSTGPSDPSSGGPTSPPSTGPPTSGPTAPPSEGPASPPTVSEPPSVSPPTSGPPSSPPTSGPPSVGPPSSPPSRGPPSRGPPSVPLIPTSSTPEPVPDEPIVPLPGLPDPDRKPDETEKDPLELSVPSFGFEDSGRRTPGIVTETFLSFGGIDVEGREVTGEDPVFGELGVELTGAEEAQFEETLREFGL